MVAEYIARISGDTSGLERAVKKASGITKKINDDEVIIKLNYDGNPQDFNKTFQNILKDCPELNIQFQYDVNKKILDGELEKLRKMEDFQIDIETGNAEQKIKDMTADIKYGYESAGDTIDVTKKKITDLYKYINSAKSAGVIINRDSITKDLRDMGDELYGFVNKISQKPIELFDLKDNDFNGTLQELRDRVKDFQDIMDDLKSKGAQDKGTLGDVSQLKDDIKILKNDISELKQQMDGLDGEAFEIMRFNVERLNDQLRDTIAKLDILQGNKKGTLKDFRDDFQSWQDRNNNKGAIEYWDTLQARIDAGDEELKNLLRDLRLFNEETGKIQTITSGNINAGGLIGDGNVLLATPKSKVSKNRDVYEDTKKLKVALDEAAESGINVARILDVLPTKNKEVVLTLQERAKGLQIGDIYKGENSFINPQIFEATDNQIQKLIEDIIELQNLGIKTDDNLTNFIYDDSKGFTLIDLDLMSTTDSVLSIEELLEDFKMRIIGDLEDFYNDIGDNNGLTSVKKLEQQFDRVAEIIKKKTSKINEARNEGVRRGIDAHSDSEAAIESTDDYINGMTHEVNNRIDDVEKSGEKLGTALGESVDEALKKSLLHLYSTAFQTGAYEEQLDKSVEISAILNNGKLASKINSNSVTKGKTPHVLIPEGDGDTIFHSHYFSDTRDNLSFDYQDIKNIISNGFDKAVLMCGEEFATMDFTGISKENRTKMLDEVRHMIQSVLLAFGATIDENGKLKGSSFSDDIYNESVYIINNLLSEILQSYGGSLSYLKREGNSIVTNSIRMNNEVPEIIKGILNYINENVENGDVDAIIAIADSVLESRDQVDSEISTLRENVDKLLRRRPKYKNTPNIPAVTDQNPISLINTSTLDKQQEELNETSSKIEKVSEAYETMAYRGVKAEEAIGKMSENYNGAKFYSSEKSVAKFFGENLESANLKIDNPFVIDANNKPYTNIHILGDGLDENSKKAIEFKNNIDDVYAELSKLVSFNLDGYWFDQYNPGMGVSVIFEEIQNLMSLEETQDEKEKEQTQAKIKRIAELRDTYLKLISDYSTFSSDTSHPYGVKTADQLVEYAQNAGFGGAVIKNIDDDDTRRYFTDIVAFAQNQIEYLQKIVHNGSQEIVTDISYLNNVLKTPNKTNDIDSYNKEIDKKQERISKLKKQTDELKQLISNYEKGLFDKISSEQQESIKNGEIENIIEHNEYFINKLEKQITEIKVKRDSLLSNETPVSSQEKVKENTASLTEEIKKQETELGRLIQYWGNVNEVALQRGNIVNETAAYFNTSSGQISSYVKGEPGHLSQEIIDSAFNQAKIAVDGAIHTHGDWAKAAFSPGDLKTAYNDVLRGIKTQVLMTMDEVMTLDLNGVNGRDLADIINEYEVRSEEVKQKLTQDGINDIDVLQQEYQKILANLFDAKNLSSHLKLESRQDWMKNNPALQGFEPTLLSYKTSVLNTDNQSVTDNIVEESAARDKNVEVIREETAAQEALNQAQQEARVVQNQIETENLNKLLSLLIAVKQAVDEKTEAFGQEGLVVSQTVKAENDDLSLLLETIKAISDALGGIKLPTEGKLDWVKDLKKIDANQIQVLSDSLKNIYDGVKKLDLKDSNFVNQLNGILAKGKELENLAKVLSSTKKDLNDTAKATKSNRQAESKKTYDAEFANRKKILDLKYKIAEAEAKGEDKDLAEKRYQPEIAALEKIVDAEKKRRTEQKLTNKEYRNNIEHELSVIRQKQNAEIEGIRAVTVERNRQAQQQNLVGNIDQQLKDLENAKKSINDLLGQKKSGLTPSYVQNAEEKVKELEEHIKKLEKMRVDIVDAKDLSELEEAKNLTKELVDSAKKVKADATDSANKLAKDIKIKNLDEEITDFLTKNTKLSAEFRAELDALRKKLSGDNLSNQDILDIASAFTEVKVRAKEAGDVGKSQIDTIKQRLSDMNAKFLAQFLSWQDLIRYVRTLASTVVELDTAITELRKVSDAPADRLKESFRASADTAKELGSSITEVINKTSDWARLGYNIDDAEKLAKVTTLFQTVGDNMSSEDASSYLISTLQGFQMTADQSMEIIDRYNEVANNFAIDTRGIGEALQRSAASFNAANTDLSKSIALITATNTVVQNPESVGTLWKTMSARIRGAKSELIELGEEEDTIVESTSKLRDMVKGMTGFDIMKDENTFKDIYEIVLGIGKEWSKLTDIERASLGEALAGKRNANALFAVLDNIETLEKAYETAADAEGSALKEQENYAKSLQFEIDRIKANAQDISANIIHSETLKSLLQLVNSIAEGVANITSNANALKVAIGAAIGAFSSFKGVGRRIVRPLQSNMPTRKEPLSIDSFKLAMA